MLEIPYYTYTLLCQYYEKFMKPLVGDEWKAELKKAYDAFAAKRETKSAADGEWPLMDDFCKDIIQSFYTSMSSICRPMFKTELIQDGFIEKLRNVFKGKND